MHLTINNIYCKYRTILERTYFPTISQHILCVARYSGPPYYFTLSGQLYLYFVLLVCLVG